MNTKFLRWLRHAGVAGAVAAVMSWLVPDISGAAQLLN
jgi:hypothetical protein